MNTEQIINERLKVLPEEIKLAIKSTDLAVKFNTISEKHNLLLDKNAILQNETMFVMLGLESTDDFVRNIERELDISRNEAIAITMDVNKEIFYPLRSSLQKMQEEADFESEMEEEGEKESNSVSTIGNTVTQKPKVVSQTVTPTEQATKVVQSPVPVVTPNPIIQTPSQTPPTPPSTPTTPPIPTNHPVFVAKTIAIPKPEPTPQPAIMPKTVEEAGRFTIERPPVGMPQYKETDIKKDVILGMIEDKEKVETPTPIVISTPSYIPEKPIQNIVVENKTINPELPKQDLPKPPAIEKKPYTVDPYREQI